MARARRMMWGQGRSLGGHHLSHKAFSSTSPPLWLAAGLKEPWPATPSRALGPTQHHTNWGPGFLGTTMQSTGGSRGRQQRGEELQAESTPWEHPTMGHWPFLPEPRLVCTQIGRRWCVFAGHSPAHTFRGSSILLPGAQNCARHRESEGGPEVLPEFWGAAW